MGSGRSADPGSLVSKFHHQDFKMPVIIIVFTYFGHILQNLLYFRIFNNKYIEMAFKYIKIMLLRSENHHQVFKIIYYYVFTYFGHILQNLLYFRIFNNKY